MIEYNFTRIGIALFVLSTVLLGCARDRNTPTSVTELTADQIFSGGRIAAERHYRWIKHYNELYELAGDGLK